MNKKELMIYLRAMCAEYYITKRGDGIRTELDIVREWSDIFQQKYEAERLKNNSRKINVTTN